MISRVALVTLSSHKYRQKQVLYHASTLSAMGLAGIALHSNFQTTKMDGTKFDTSLVVPTIEAATRALNLVSTAFLMIADYEYAKFSDRFFPDDDPERRFWLKEKERRQRELEEAQRMFTAPKQDKLIEKSGKRRTMYFRDGKKLVYHAAQRLAEAEEKLAILGDPHSQVHRKAATRLLNLCRKNGGVYIKVGQHIANLDYLIPPEYIEVLSSLFDDAPQSSYSNVCKVIQEDLGKHPDELFESFEKTPIASASLAQVHVAYEKGTGKKLAIKCQHRGLRESSSGDIFAVVTVIQTIESMFKDFTFGWIADEIAPHLPIELDFVNEGKNAERAASFIAKSGLPCVIPKILWDKTSRRVLCMEFEEGFKSTDLSAIEKSGLKKRDIATLIASVFSSQVFTPDSNIHVDPHPANVLIREHKGKPLMVLVDHGLYKSIDNKFRMEYAKLWKSMMLADLDGIKETSKNLGVEEMYTLLAAILTARPFDEIMERSKSGSLSPNIKDSKSDKAMIAGYAKHFFQDIMEILGTLPRQMLLLLKMNDCLRHIDFQLGSPTNTLVITGKYASRAVYHDTLSRPNVSWLDKLRAWFDYMKIMVRIQAHDIVMWWMDTTSSLHRLTNPK